MAKKVKFENYSGHVQYVNIAKPQNVVGLKPEVFDNTFDGHAKLALIDVYASFFREGKKDEKPLVYLRHTDVSTNKYRFANIIELGDDWLDLQKGALHAEETADKNTPVNEYRKISDNPICYGYDSDEKFVECRFYENEITLKEGNFLDVKAEVWPYAMYDHQSVYTNCSTIFQPATFYGTLDGEPVIGVGEFDRLCIKESVDNFSSIPLGYLSFLGAGIREDNRKEYCICMLSLDGNGKQTIWYWLEGEQPIVYDNCIAEADWYHLPYVNDGTCVFKNANFYFGEKVIHFEGKWGLKGVTAKPRLEKHGQSQIVGTFYEGNKPYKHKASYCFIENMNAYADNLIKLGFDVVD